MQWVWLCVTAYVGGMGVMFPLAGCLLAATETVISFVLFHTYSLNDMWYTVPGIALSLLFLLSHHNIPWTQYKGLKKMVPLVPPSVSLQDFPHGIV
ncbi:hypothetical protein KIPB_012028 [Kipferlia bialata]|uniref:Uncharacterized protein n=1 Tax=Kipferlia bialata TaxID=797122 RepID=A0A9K3GP52_9EUKA|nr:hypothetical protein KIPB_012028 [Kipferlia bialata]|eukprot:g12028.t1